MTHVLHVFKKDAVELLRDRRTLFVNVLLPLLLYPLIMLFLVQVMQLTRAQREAPRVAAVGEADLERLLRACDHEEGPEDEPRAGREKTAGPGARPPAVAVVDPGAVVDHELLDLTRELLALHDDGKSPANEAQATALHARMLAELRRNRLAGAVVALEADAHRRAVVAVDDAHAEADAVRAVLSKAAEAWNHELVERGLAEHGIDRSVLEPVEVLRADLTPALESARSRLAGIIPLILVMMALSGAFHPALDLIAGERERGTLESLLSWPVRRREIFIGKLLVTCVAAVLSVVLNLGSIALTIGLAAMQIGPAAGGKAAALSAGAGSLVLCFLALLPLTVTLSALSLALAGQAQSSKEAQHYLTPLVMVVMTAAGVAMVPDARPSIALDLLPITGPVLALKEALRSPTTPWLHLGLSTCASLALAVVVVGWAARLLESERFCFPGLVRAGWGRFRRWGEQPPAPGALEAIAVYALCAAGMMLGGPLVAGHGAVAMVVAPLAAFVALPPLVHAWLGAYPAATALGLCRPGRGSWRRAAVAVPFAVMVSLALAKLQQSWLPSSGEGGAEIERVISSLDELGGLPLLVLCIGIVPGVCEEVLCRGTLLHGLRRSVGSRGAVVLSSFLFAVLHMDPSRFLPQFAVGLALGALALRCGSILPGMLLHAGHNALHIVMPWAKDRGWTEVDWSEQLGARPLTLLVLGGLGLAVAVGALDRPLERLRRSRALVRRRAVRAARLR